MTQISKLQWQCLPFNELDIHQLYALLRLRVDIFVVEQTCPYPELDGKDRLRDTRHLVVYRDRELIAYARLLAPGGNHDNPSIGRVATSKTARGNGLGHQLITAAIDHCRQLWPDTAIDISAQAYLQDFYTQYGFNPISNIYLEDGIEHIDMRLEKANIRSHKSF